MRTAAVIAVALLAGCAGVSAFDVACNDDSQCPDGTVCSLEMGFCVAPNGIDAGTDAGNDAGPSTDGGLNSRCGQPGDQGNGKGVGRFCMAGTDCPTTAQLCTASAKTLTDTYFCTRECTTSDDCGKDAYCGCRDSTCICIPSACSDLAPALDGGPADAGSVDGGTIDAGVRDAGVIDGGVVDAGTRDAGVPDAGAKDAGTSPCETNNGGCPAGTTCHFNGSMIDCVCNCVDSNGQCADTTSDPKNCGGCGIVCNGSDTCCDSQCVNLKTDVNNCGHCGNQCMSPSNACLGSTCCTMTAPGVCL